MKEGDVRRVLRQIARAVLKISRLGIAAGKIQDNDGLHHPQTRRHIDLIAFMIRRHIKQDAAILDVGCGRGMLAQRLQTAGFMRIIGIDWLPESDVDMSAIGQYHHANLNLEGLKRFPDRSFDCVICSDVLEHLENPAKMLRELSRVCKETGDIFITLPNAFNLFERLKILLCGNSSRYSKEAPGTYGHISMLPSEVLQSLLYRAGLQLVAIGKGYCMVGGMFLFGARRFGPLLSYVHSMHLRRTANPADLSPRNE